MEPPGEIPPVYFRCRCGAVIGRVVCGHLEIQRGDFCEEIYWGRITCPDPDCGHVTTYYPPHKIVQAYMIAQDWRQVEIERKARGMR